MVLLAAMPLPECTWVAERDRGIWNVELVYGLVRTSETETEFFVVVSCFVLK